MDYKIKLKTSLKTIFGCNNYLNELQEQAVENILKRKRDIFVSGYGKSLCYQLPVMVKDNSFIIVITFRISSYIKKYTNYFINKQVTVNYLTANTSRRKKKLIESDIISKKSDIKILFITPLQYETAYFKTILKKIDKSRLLGIVIDQADNIFSKQENLCNHYQNLDLKIIRVPIVTITSATSAKIQEDIIKDYNLLNPKVYAMSTLRANLYCDMKFINIIPKPMEHLTNFIKICLAMNSDIHSKKEKSLGLIVCKDLETTTSIAKSLRSEKITVLLSDTYLIQDKRSKHTNLGNFKDVRVILVCEKDNTVSVTSSLLQVMAPKPVKFIIYWQVLPNIEKYYLLVNKVQCVYEASFCRVYCKVDRLIDNWMKSSCQNDSNNELSTVILSSLTNMHCRHKTYSNFFEDIYAACKNRCDICKNQNRVKDKIKELMEIIDNLNLREKLQQILKMPKDSNKICDENLQYKFSQPKTSNHMTDSNVNVRAQKENREEDYSSVDTNFANYNEAIPENHVEIEKKRKALSELSDIYSKTWKNMSCQAFSLSSSSENEIGANGISKGEESFSNKSLYSDNEHKSMNNPPATQSSNVRIVNGIKKMYVEASETCQRVIPIAYKYRLKKNLNGTDGSQIDSTKNSKTKGTSSTETRYLDNQQYKFSSKKSHQSKKKTIEVITISDDDVADPNKVNISNKKRHCSTVQTQGSFEQTKRRKLS